MSEAAATAPKIERARATFDWEPTDESQLRLKAGDVVTVFSREGGEWWEGELNGAVGFFPGAYVERIPTEDALAAVLYDFDEAGPDLINLKAGAVCALLDVSADDWWLVGCGDKLGWFPSAFLRVLQDSELGDMLHGASSQQQQSASQPQPLTPEGKSARKAMWRRTVALTPATVAAEVEKKKKAKPHHSRKHSKRRHDDKKTSSSSPSAPSSTPETPEVPEAAAAAPPKAPAEPPKQPPVVVAVHPPADTASTKSDKEHRSGHSSSGKSDKQMRRRIDLLFTRLQEMKELEESNAAKLDQVMQHQQQMLARMQALEELLRRPRPAPVASPRAAPMSPQQQQQAGTSPQQRPQALHRASQSEANMMQSVIPGTKGKVQGVPIVPVAATAAAQQKK